MIDESYPNVKYHHKEYKCKTERLMRRIEDNKIFLIVTRCKMNTCEHCFNINISAIKSSIITQTQKCDILYDYIIHKEDWNAKRQRLFQADANYYKTELEENSYFLVSDKPLYKNQNPIPKNDVINELIKVINSKKPGNYRDSHIISSSRDWKLMENYTKYKILRTLNSNNNKDKLIDHGLEVKDDGEITGEVEKIVIKITDTHL